MFFIPDDLPQVFCEVCINALSGFSGFGLEQPAGRFLKLAGAIQHTGDLQGYNLFLKLIQITGHIKGFARFSGF